MGCRCRERGQAIVRAAGAAVRGDARAVAVNAAYVGRTMVQDGAALARRAAAARLSVRAGKR